MRFLHPLQRQLREAPNYGKYRTGNLPHRGRGKEVCPMQQMRRDLLNKP